MDTMMSGMMMEMPPYEGHVRMDLLKMAKQNSNFNEYMTYDSDMKDMLLKDMEATAKHAETECDMAVASHLRDEMKRFK